MKKVPRFIYPDYQQYSFANIPSTILALFGLKTNRPTLPPETYQSVLTPNKSLKIILFLIDGLGFNAWQKYGKDYEAFRLIAQNGRVSSLTAIFPSTTAAALTTVSSGLTPQEHGLFEWFVYMPEVDKIIATLPFSLPGEKDQDTLAKTGYNPKMLYSGRTIYQALKREGVTSYSFINYDYAKSAYSQVVHHPSFIVPFKNASDLITNLINKLENTAGPAYFYIYWDSLDSTAHHFGPDSKEYLQELKKISSLLEKFLEMIKPEIARQTVLILTADHGETAINPEKTIFLNKIAELEEFFEISKAGRPILPCGNPRDVFSHIKPEKLKKAKKFLAEKLKNKAEILEIEEVVKMGLFGLGRPSRKFLERAGNLLILPYRNNTLWYEYPGVKLSEFFAHHGGLSEEEMLIPFAVARLQDLL